MRGDLDDMDPDDFDFESDDVRGGEVRARVRRATRGPAAESGGLELVGGVLFLAGCLPAAAVAKALQGGTDLTSEGLGGTAALAAGVAGWVGAWPALLMAGSLAVIGALMVVGSIRTEPLRYVAGALVAGLGLAAVVSAFEPGAGGRLGDGTGGALASGLGTLAGAALGFAVIGASLWLALKSGGSVDATSRDDDLEPLDEGSERESLPARLSRGLASTRSKLEVRREKRRADEGPGLGDRARRQRKIQSKPTRHRGAPATLGDALARGGGEGVSHDEAAALAPDDNTLAYMEDVWRRASASYQQAEPIPPSPYPDDVRLRGQIPPGTQPLERPHEATTGGHPSRVEATSASAPERPLAPDPSPAAGLPEAISEVTSPGFDANDIAPFDFSDELSTPVPLESPPASGSRADDPFGAPPPPSGSLSKDEASALRSAVAREGASLSGPSDLPTGVAPLAAKPSPREDEPIEDPDEPVLEDPTIERADSSASTLQAVQAGAMPTQPTAPPTPSWEKAADEEGKEPVVEEVAEVNDDGHWPRREEESAETAESEGDDVEYEYVDEDGNPIDPADLDEDEYEFVDEEDLGDDEADEGDDEASEDASDEEDETTVVLEPHAAPTSGAAAEPVTGPLPDVSSDGERLLEAGRIVVREGRVAVSLLQRAFDCDFDEACAILDELQGEGLIGPYKGGKARDILLSSEEWEGRFAHS